MNSGYNYTDVVSSAGDSAMDSSGLRQVTWPVMDMSDDVKCQSLQ